MAGNRADWTQELGDAYRRQSVALFNYFRRCGVPPDAAADLLHATFLTVLERPDGYDPGRGPMSAYLFGIARHLRLAWVRGLREDRTALEERLPSVASSTLVDDIAVRDAVGQLPDDFREALVLREFHGLTYEQIAAVQDAPVGTVRSRLARAREVLRSRLARHAAGKEKSP